MHVKTQRARLESLRLRLGDTLQCHDSQNAFETLAEMFSPDPEPDILDEFFDRPDELVVQVAGFRSFEQQVKSHESDWSWPEEMGERQDGVEDHHMSGGLPLDLSPDGTRREGKWI
jgi:hypothetical protein